MQFLEAINSAWVFAALCFAIGLAMGVLAAYLVVSLHGKQHKLQEELDQLKERFTDYREQVTHHFMRTSELVEEMTESYKHVYEHLATGAQYLCGSSTEIQQKLDSEQAEALEKQADDMEPGMSFTGEEDFLPTNLPETGVRIGKKILPEESTDKPVQH